MICRNVKMLAAATVAVVLLAAGAWAQGPWKCGAVGDSTNVMATLSNGTLTISGTGDMLNYSSETAVPWRGSRSSITGAVVGEGVTNIGNYAFYACSSMTSVTIGNDVTSIGNYAFWGCTGLTSVTIPDGVTSIGTGVFMYCTNLTSIETGDGNSAYSSVAGVLFNKDKSTLVVYPGGKQGAYSIPNSVTSIGAHAFFGCAGLTVTIPDGVTSIGNYAFYGCTGLTSVTIPDGITSIGTDVFNRCTGLTSVAIGSGVTSIPSGMFSGCTGLTSVAFPNNVKTIEMNVLSGCTGLTTVTIGTGLTSFGIALFSSATGLTSIVVDDDNAYFSSEDGILFNKNKTALCAYPIGKQGTTYSIPNSVTSIGNSAFRNCTGLTSLTIPNSVRTIENFAFTGCTGLTSVTIPSSVTSIGGSAFQLCSSLTSMTSLAEVPPTLVGTSVFSGLSAVLYVYVPEGSAAAYRAADQWKSLSIIDGSPAIWECGASPNAAAVTATLNTTDWTLTISGTGAMANYTSTTVPWAGYRNFITDVVIGDGVTNIGDYAFSACSSMTSVTIPSSVTSIGTYVFSGCTGLTSVTIGSGITSIGNYAFQGCTSLTSIETGDGNSAYSSVAGVLFDKDKSTLVAYPVGKQGAYSIPTGVTSIGLAAFYGCAGLTSVTIPSSVTSIGTSVFRNCTGLTSVTIGSGVTSIGNSAFETCTGLTSVTIPDGVTSIGDYAFYGCAGLTSVTSLIEVPLTINSNVFTRVPVASATLYVPEDAVEDYRAADVWKSFVTIEAKLKNSVTSGDRVIPQTKPKEEATVIAPVTVLSGEFTAGPNPVSKQSGSVNFYRQGKRVSNSELRIYDATGNVISKVKISDKALNCQARRIVGSWNLTDKNGRTVSEGTYLVKGVVKTSDGKSEKVSVIVSVR